ncbi:hypothetical protein ACP4OV_006671 [Aristida adscensionis]
MLTGRESLVRLIGRRRRSPLPASLAALLSPSSPAPSIPTSQTDDGGGGAGAEAEAASGAAGSSSGGGPGWVACPVCGESIPGSDYSVNTHLDICLTRGTKRKLAQSTLLDFRFSKKVAAGQTYDVSNNDDGTANMKQIDEDLSNGDISETFATFKPSDTVLPNVEDAANDPAVEHCSSSMLPSVATSGSIDACADIEPITTVSVDTVIVGRRFHENIELREGAGIAILRDPQNSKDPDAIKVLYAASDCKEMLGYVPRELAKVLAPLIDKQYVECQGIVVGLPEQQLDNVRIQITIHKCKTDDSINGDPKDVELLWENFISAVRNGNFQRSNSFKLLSDDGQRLFVRIYTRKGGGPWFRMSSITYREISDLEHAARELKVTGYIDMLSSTDDPSEYDMKEILDVLSVPEMKEILKELPKDNNMSCKRRHELLTTLLSVYHNGTCTGLQNQILKWTGTCIRISEMADELLWRVQRLFFLNGDQDLSSFLLVEFGLVKFPDYDCKISHRVFQERSDLLEYEEAIRVAQVMDESLDNNEMEMVTRCIDLSENRLCSMPKQENVPSAKRPPPFFSRFSASWVYSKILTLGVSVYERDRRYTDAIRILRILLSKVPSDRRRGYWTLRLSVDMEHMGRPNESLSIAEGGVIDPWVRAGSKFALQKRVLRLSKPPRRWKVPSYADYVRRNIKEVSIEGRPLNCETGTKNVFYGYNGELCGVEQLALQYYADEGGGWQGIHSEGGIWMTIFGLLMWDVMFSDMQDVFLSKFQTAPLDLETDDFYEARKDLVESQLRKIEGGMAEEMLISSWELHKGTSCQGVNWDRHCLTDLRAVVACIGGHCLASLLRHLAVDYRSWSSGMPDLLLWRFLDERGGGEAKLVEVKGPRDQLSEQQRAWIHVLVDFGFDVEVCKVSPFQRGE